MNWIIESLCAVVFYVLMQVLYKFNGRAGVPAPIINLIALFGATLAYLIVALGQNFNIFSFLLLLLVLFTAICVYATNAASLRAFNNAPNPGYSQAIVKSHAALTTIAAIFFFGGELNWQKIFGIFLILTSQLLITGNPVSKKNSENADWIKLSFSAFFASAALAIAIKYASANLHIDNMVFLFWITLMSLPLFIVEISIKKIPHFEYKRQIASLFWMGLFAGIANVFMWNAFVDAPNMGYVNAIQVASVAIISLLAVKLFGDELTKKKSLGILGVTLGLILIILD
jgi:drug/metabolite transporter (DMT)-like permease